MHGRTRLAAAVCAAGMAATLALAGCSADSSDSSAQSGGAPGVSEELAPAEGGAAAPQQQQKRATDTAAKAPDLRVEERSIIYTGSITVRVDDVNTAAARATGIVTAAGGFIGGDKRNSSDEGSSDATLTLRVPAEKFTAVVNQLAELGKEEQRGINTEDVTEETIDLDARIATQQARVDSGRKLLAQAKDLEDLVMLEREVATRESDLASLQAKKRRLADLTALSTITVVLLDPQAVAEEDDDAAPGFLAGLRDGWDGLVASLTVVVTVLGWLLPWLLLLALPALAVRWYVRRNRRPQAGPAPALEEERA